MKPPAFHAALNDLLKSTLTHRERAQRLTELGFPMTRKRMMNLAYERRRGKIAARHTHLGNRAPKWCDTRWCPILDGLRETGCPE